MYPDTQIDRCLLTIVGDLVRELRFPQIVTQLSISASASTLTLTTLTSAGFLPEHIDAAYLDGVAEPLRLTSWDELWKAKYESNEDGDTEGVPTLLAFNSHTSASIYPLAEEAYTLNIRWHAPLTAWTPGTASATTIQCGSITVPEEWMRWVCSVGVPWLLQFNEPEHQYSQVAKAMYDDFKKRYPGAGSLGVRVVRRDTPTDW